MKPVLQVLSFDFVSKVVLGLAAMALIRYMPPHEYAAYTFAASIAAAVTQTLSSAFNRVYIIGHETLGLKEELTPFFGFQLIAIVVVTAAAYPFLGDRGFLFWFVGLLVLSQCFSEFVKTMYQQELRFLSFSLVEFLRSILFAAGLAALIWSMRQDLRAWQALSAQAAAGFLVFLAVFARKIHYRKLLDVGRALDIAKRILLGRYKYLFVYFTVLAVFSQLDVFMLKSMGTDMMVATYGTAYRYYAMILLTLGAIHTVFLPMIQQAGSSRELDGIFKKQWRMVAFLAPAILVGAWLAQWILPFIDMGKYPRAVPVFRILCVSAIISLAFSPYVNLVMRFEEFPFLLGLVLVGCVVSAGMNMVLVPRLQEIGTAISTLVSFLIVNGLTFLKAMKLRRALDVPGGPPPGAVVQTE